MKQDLLWEAWVLLAYGKAAPILTRSERGAINSALKELREIGATPDDMRRKWAAYKTKWPKLGNPTITALTKHWNSLETRSSSRRPSYIPPQGRATPEGIKTAYELLPSNVQRMLKAKHNGG